MTYPLHHILQRAIALYPQRLAVVDGALRLDYRQLGERVHRLAAGLLGMGLKRGDRVAILDVENVYSIEIESVLSLHPSLAEVAVIGIPDEKWGEGRGKIASYKVPKSVVFRSESLPKTGPGKIAKRVLRRPLLEKPGRDIPDMQLYDPKPFVFEGAGHNVHVERPDEVWQWISIKCLRE